MRKRAPPQELSVIFAHKAVLKPRLHSEIHELDATPRDTNEPSIHKATRSTKQKKRVSFKGDFAVEREGVVLGGEPVASGFR